MLTDALHAALNTLPETQFKDQNGDPVDRSKQLITASTLGGCIRRRWFSLHDATPDNDTDDPTGRFERGRVMEDWIVDRLREGGVVIERAKKLQRSICDPDTGISGTPDGIIMDMKAGQPEAVLEIKSIDPRTAEHNLPREQHVKQVQLNIELARALLMLDVDAGVLLYVDASDWKKTYEYRIGREPQVLVEAIKRAAQIDKADKPDELLPEGQTKGECRYCEFKSVCGEAKFKSYSSSAKGTNTIAALVDEVLTIEDALREPQAQVRKIKDSIKDEMLKNNSSMVDSDLGTAELAEIPGRRSFDWTAADNDGIDVSPYTKVGKASARLTLKRK